MALLGSVGYWLDVSGIAGTQAGMIGQMLCTAASVFDFGVRAVAGLLRDVKSFIASKWMT